MLRKYIIFTIIIAFTVLMAGCDLNKKIGESITEGILENAIGDDVEVKVDGEDISFSVDEKEVDIDEEVDVDQDVDVVEEDANEVKVEFDEDDEGITIKGEDGSVMATGSIYEWPEGQAADYLPKFNEGKIFYILNSDDTCVLMLQETTEDDYKDYVEELIEEGYTSDKFESAAEDMLFYTALSEKGIATYVSFIKSEATMQISVDISGITN